MVSRSRAASLAWAWCLIAISLAGCSGARSLDPTCEWADETASPLDLESRAGQRHLVHDALVAEEIAIRYADARRGIRSGQFTDRDEYRRTRERCLTALSQAIASRHDIAAARVRDAVGRRDIRRDVIYLLLCAALFAFAANEMVAGLVTRFPADEPWPARIAAVVSSPFVSAAGVIIGGLGASVIEMIAVGNTHLSYRAYRIPWNEHWLLFYFGALALFGLVAGARLGGRWRGRKLAE